MPSLIVLINRITLIPSQMTHVRRLLKPGGYLILLEITNTDTIHTTFLVGGIKGWWAGQQDGRIWGPMLSVPAWDQLLQRMGFRGIDVHTMLGNPKFSVNSIIVFQAIDDRIQLLHDLLAIPSKEFLLPQLKDLVILGGATRLVIKLSNILESRFDRIIRARMPESLELGDSSNPAVLSLVDIDRSCFQDLTEDCLQSLQALTTVAGKLLWVTVSPESDCPYYGMSKGWLKSLAHENKKCLYQYLNIDNRDAVDSSPLVTTLMHLVCTDSGNVYTLLMSITPNLSCTLKMASCESVASRMSRPRINDISQFGDGYARR
jgi:hypothetical protein